MKKSLALALVSALTISMLTGCGEAQSPVADVATDVVEETAEVVEEAVETAEEVVEEVAEVTDQELADNVAALIDAIYVQERTDKTDEQCAEALAYYREYYSVTGLLENEVYDGIIDLLKQLKAAGKTIILATSKPEEYSVRILEHFNLLEYFDDVSGATMDEKRSKKDEIITYALRKNNIVDTNKCVMIGDRKYDILGGKKNHLKTMGVLYGYGSHEELTAAGADYLVSSPAEIFKI